jgi:glycosyltransferase involved in cell wall biosynthesis
MKLSIIIPAHNEEKRIEETLRQYSHFFQKKYKKDFEIIVILNGCLDDTLGIVKKIAKKYKQIKYFDFKQSGKGFAIIKGFKASRGELIGFVDADCSTSPESFYDLVKRINGYGGIIASRWMKGSIVHPKQPFSRRLASRLFNFLVRFLFGIRSQDTQCGAKLFKKDAIKRILPGLGITAWAFDIDLLYRLKEQGYSIKDIPTTWSDKGNSRLNVGKTSFQMFLAVIRLRLINSPFRFIVRAYELLPENIKIHRRLK